MNVVHRVLAGATVVSLVLAGCARSTQEDLEAPDAAEPLDRDAEAQPVLAGDASTSPDEERDADDVVGADEATEHVRFEEVDAREGPADGVVAQPQRDPMPSMLDPKKWGPR